MIYSRLFLSIQANQKRRETCQTTMRPTLRTSGKRLISLKHPFSGSISKKWKKVCCRLKIPTSRRRWEKIWRTAIQWLIITTPRKSRENFQTWRNSNQFWAKIITSLDLTISTCLKTQSSRTTLHSIWKKRKKLSIVTSHLSNSRPLFGHMACRISLLIS